ncbi:hypothetical protein [Rhodococcus sp. NPDC057529]
MPVPFNAAIQAVFGTSATASEKPGNRTTTDIIAIARATVAH